MSQFHAAMPHGSIEEVFPDVFFITGTMKSEFFGSMWHFSRNMTVVREGRRLTIINAVRLGPEGLAALDELGQVVNLVRIGDLARLMKANSLFLLEQPCQCGMRDYDLLCDCEHSVQQSKHAGVEESRWIDRE